MSSTNHTAEDTPFANHTAEDPPKGAAHAGASRLAVDIDRLEKLTKRVKAMDVSDPRNPAACSDMMQQAIANCDYPREAKGPKPARSRFERNQIIFQAMNKGAASKCECCGKPCKIMVKCRCGGYGFPC